MTDFPTLSYTSTREIPTLSYTWNVKKVTLYDGASPYRPLQVVPPPHPGGHDTLFEYTIGCQFPASNIYVEQFWLQQR